LKTAARCGLFTRRCGNPAFCTLRKPSTIPMQKLSLFAASAAILLAGCEAPQKSHTWETVRAVRHSGPAAKTPALDYARELHGALQGAGVEHRVVTFKFRYRSRLLLNREGEETAVIYRDPTTPAQPWWLMAERLSTPVWIPSQPLESQVSFFVSRPATVVRVEEFAAKHAGKHRHAGKGGKPAGHRTKSKRGKS
jgi:hypothetical protein